MLKTIEVGPLLRAIIAFDLVVTAFLAVPGLSQAFIHLVDFIGSRLGVAAPLPAFSPFQMFMVNLAGVLGVAWNLLRWHLPSWDLARLDAWARIAVAALIFYYVLLAGVTPVLLAFAVTELLGSAVEFRLRPQQAG